MRSVKNEKCYNFCVQSFDALSQVSYNDNDDDPSGNGGNAYSLLYIGLVLSNYRSINIPFSINFGFITSLT
jgi:hypothetical protein